MLQSGLGVDVDMTWQRELRETLESQLHEHVGVSILYAS